MTTGVARDARTVTKWNLLSRLTGFGRVLVIGGALGATRLGDTYQAANQISNLLFEFLAAGTLAAVLVPGVTARLVSDEPARAEAFAGALLGRALTVLGALAVVGVVLARPIMDAVLAGNDGATRPAQVRLGAFLLLFVMPQLVLYAWGAVMTAVLNAHGHFGAGAAAPVANNVVVIVAVGLVWFRGVDGLDPGGVDRALLGGGALVGVACMTLVPVAAAARYGLHVRPRWRSDDALTMSAREIAWASLVIVPAQLFLFASMMVSSRVAGGVVATQIGFTLFLLPQALLGHPLTTVLYPRLARACAAGARDEMHQHSAQGLQALLLLTAPAAALLVALADWILPLISVGALGQGAGPAVVAAALAGYGIGLSAYSWSLFTTRVSYASSDVRSPGLAAVLGGGVGLLALGFAAATDGTALLYRVGLAHSLMMVTTVALTLAILHRRGVIMLSLSTWAGVVVAATAAGVAARVVADRFGPAHDRLDALGAVVAAGVVAVVVYAAGIALARVRVRELRAALT